MRFQKFLGRAQNQSGVICFKKKRYMYIRVLIKNALYGILHRLQKR